jgi:Ni,Fe-hydrogenase III large subunit
MDTSSEASGSKRQCVREAEGTMKGLEFQNDIYAAEKFSGSLSISHAVDLSVAGERVTHVHVRSNIR